MTRASKTELALYRPTPFLKWAGGKSKLVPEILKHLPEKMGTYYEPFIGGGAVFFSLVAEGRFRRAVLSDANNHLVEVYQVVRDEVDALMELLEAHQAQATSESYFYSIRAQDPQSMSRLERAARFIFLNKTCFNGLYRQNKKGEFNVPFGHYRKPRLFQEEVLLNASQALGGVEIVNSDFEESVAQARRGGYCLLRPAVRPSFSDLVIYGIPSVRLWAR